MAVDHERTDGVHPLRLRRLGSTSFDVSVICIGTWALGGDDWGGQEEGTAIRAIQAALDSGMLAIDTAPAYGLGRAERFVGKAIQGRTSWPLLMTKAGLRWDGDGGTPLRPRSELARTGDRFYRDSRPESLRLQVEHSLERLQVEVIDLLQIHWPDPRTPVAETMGALLELRREGKIREIGVSNYPIEMLEEVRKALGEVPLAAIQAPCSPLTPPSEVIRWADAHGVGVLAYKALEHSLLTSSAAPGRHYACDDHRSRHRSFSRRNRARVSKVLRTVVKPIADRHGATLVQTILAWTLAQPGVTAALVGVRSAEQAREDAGAGGLELLPIELERIRQAFAKLERPSAAHRWLRSAFRSVRRRQTIDANNAP